jgi:hypothetical protein
MAVGERSFSRVNRRSWKIAKPGAACAFFRLKLSGRIDPFAALEDFEDVLKLVIKFVSNDEDEYGKSLNHDL